MLSRAMSEEPEPVAVCVSVSGTVPFGSVGSVNASVQLFVHFSCAIPDCSQKPRFVDLEDSRIE